MIAKIRDPGSCRSCSRCTRDQLTGRRRRRRRRCCRSGTRRRRGGKEEELSLVKPDFERNFYVNKGRTRIFPRQFGLFSILAERFVQQTSGLSRPHCGREIPPFGHVRLLPGRETRGGRAYLRVGSEGEVISHSLLDAKSQQILLLARLARVPRESRAARRPASTSLAQDE